MSEKNFGQLGATFQESLLKTIIEEKKFATTIIDVIDSKYFDTPYFKYLMQSIKEFYVNHKTIPTYTSLREKVLSSYQGKPLGVDRGFDTSGISTGE